MRVLALIPTYNRARFVADAVESALAQSHPCEVLVVDDGSTDDTERVLQPYTDRIRYVRQEHSGRSTARNHALESDSDLIAFLDSDDAWLPDAVQRRVEMLDADSSLAFTHGHVAVVDELGRLEPSETARHRALFAEANAGDASYARFSLVCRCLTSAVMVRRTALEEAGGYDPAFEHLEDLDLYLRLLLIGRAAFLDGEPLVRYRLHDTQSENETLARAQIAVANKHLALLADGHPVPEARLARRNLEISIARAHHLLLEPAGVRRATLRAIGARPDALFMPGVARGLALSFAPKRLVSRARKARAQ